MAEATPNPNPAVTTTEDFTASVPESWRAAQAQLSGPAQRIALIEDSQRCCLYGWLSLVPLLGTFFVLPTLKYFRRVDRQRAAWNPGQHLLLRGLVLASCGYLTSLLWWGLFMLWLGSVTDVIGIHDLGGGDPLVILGYVLLFGSAPMVVGLTAAAARWSNRFGTFVGKYRVGLVALALAAYGGLLALLSAEGWPGAGVRLKAIGSVTTSIYGPIITWSLWTLGGFVGLALWKTKPPWSWFVWLLGAALLTAWMTAN